jgi:hypothetical protein
MSYLWDAWDKGTLSLDKFSELFDMSIKSSSPVMTKGDKILPPPPKEIMVVPCQHLDLKALEHPGIVGHKLNPGSFARDWISANLMVRLRLRSKGNPRYKNCTREKLMTMQRIP